MSRSPFKNAKGRSEAYSLIELLVVMSVIAVMLGVGAQMVPRTGRPCDAAQMVEAAVADAQADAVATGNPARVVLCVDSSAGSSYLQSVATLVDVQTNPTLSPQWAYSSPVRALPPATYLWLDYSKTVNTMKLNPHFSPTTLAPGQDGISGSLTYAYIEFDPTGQLAATTASGQVQSDVQWVFTHGIVPAGVTNPEPVHTLDRDGFIVRRLGKISLFSSPAQIQQP